MALTEEQRNKISDWLRLKKVNMACPSCGEAEWATGDIVAIPKFKEGLILGGEVIPMIQLVCANCSYVRLYAAIPIGLLEPKSEESPAGKSQPDDDTV